MNQSLKKGDRVMLLHMEDQYSSLSPGTWGTVTNVSFVFGVKQYGVNWDDGTKELPGEFVSKLSLLSDVDMWSTEGFKKKTNETKEISKKDFLKENGDLEKEWERNMNLLSNKDVLRFFDMRFFNEFLKTLRETGIANMVTESQPYLYMGRDRIKHNFVYNDPPDEESFDRLLDIADESQAKMIDGVIKALESQGRDVDLDSINSYLKKYSNKIVKVWVTLYYM